MKTGRKYDHQTLHEEREYGLFWYDWLWKLLRPVLIGVCAVILLCGIALTGWNWLGEQFWLPMNADDTAEVTFVVESGSSLSRVTSDLEEQGLIRNHAVLRYLMDFKGLSQKVQAGSYKLTRSMTLTDIMEKLTEGDGNALTKNITIIPGWNMRDIAAYLVQEGVASGVEDVYAAFRSTSYGDYYYIADVISQPNVSNRYSLLEGYLAPDTYEIYTSSSLDTVLRKLLSQTEVVFTSAMHERADALGMSMDEVITLASMIELEAKENDFAKVSAIFHNRLKLGMPLGSDVTVQYCTGSTRMVLTGEALATDSLYNTYRYVGLPVGPVCNPSKSAIMAALYPDESFIAEQYLYFCSTSPEEGTLYFSKTQEEHNQAVAIYRPLWEQYDAQRNAQ